MFKFDVIRGYPVKLQIIKNKYNNIKVYYKDLKFDSIEEFKRYIDLTYMQRAGKIKDLELQPKFILQEKTERAKAITYRADFQYYDLEKKEIVTEDVKGMITQKFSVIKRLFDDRITDRKLVIIKKKSYK